MIWISHFALLKSFISELTRDPVCERSQGWAVLLKVAGITPTVNDFRPLLSPIGIDSDCIYTWNLVVNILLLSKMG